ncbi:MAG: putative lipid II flippase FtsW [Elusimicrobia bacterium]|nr:putative lipid II flippase FtsW [Elusimicrobiota bacterium]
MTTKRNRQRRFFSNLFNNKAFRRMDFSFLFLSGILLTFGLLSLYSASAIYAVNKYADSFYFLKRQVLWIFIGLGFMFLVSGINFRNLRLFVKPAIISVIALLIITLFCAPIANVRRWISLGFMNFQTSELAKIMIIIYFADYFDRNISKISSNWKALIQPMAIFVAILILIAIQPDLGTPVIIFATALLIFFAAGLKKRHIITPILAMIPLFIYELFAHNYRLERIKVFLSPWNDQTNAGYQIVQSLLAVGSGGWFGKGLGASKLKLMYLPEPHTDFIFPVIAEELGLLGSMAVVMLFLILLLKGIKIAKNANNLFSSLLTLGIIFSISLQAFFNIAMTIGLIPTKGLPLPFFSYGGSSMVMTLIAIGIVLNISAQGSRQ